MGEKRKNEPNDIAGLIVIFRSPFSVFLLCIPAGWYSATHGWGDVWTFSLNFLALLPLAKILGDATEELATALKNDAVAGILNATFGNFVEMMITVNSLKAQMFDVVKGTLMGSILSNMLLVLGMAFVAGGLKKGKGVEAEANGVWGGVKYVNGEKVQTFASQSVSMAMLLFSCLSFALPSIFAMRYEADILTVSRFGAILVMSSYIMFLIFQLCTHSNTLQAADRAAAADAVSAEEEAEEFAAADAVEEEAEANLTKPVSVGLMLLVTILTDRVSDYLCEAIKGLIAVTGMPELFLGVILLPIAGNACEHLGAVRFCYCDKTGLALGIAIGSSTQVALFVVPFAVIAGMVMDEPMDMNFGAINTAVIVVSVLLVSMILQDQQAHWLKGYLLMLAYVFIAILYWFLPPERGEHF